MILGGCFIPAAGVEIELIDCQHLVDVAGAVQRFR